MAPACKICGSGDIEAVGSKYGAFSQRDYQLKRCAACRYAFVSDPWLDYAAIYSEAYYTGRGADRLLDYLFELEHPADTIRQYEWRGILSCISDLTQLTAETQWLDFGSGNGGLVRFARETSPASAFGYEQGWISERAREAGIPMLDDSDLEKRQHGFDIVTAIEVLEHVADPVAELRKIRRLLKPGGLLFFTTGNAEPYREKLLTWSYFVPEIHISLYESRTMEIALRAAGFRPDSIPRRPGFTDIIRFKILKNCGLRRPALWERLLPWQLLSGIVDSRFKVSAHPVGWAI